MEGWIKLYRELLEKPIWITSTPEQKTILITLLLMANHKDKEWQWQGNKYTCKPGQFITSLESIVKNSGKGISIQNTRTALKRFQKYEFLTDESTKQNRLITICNWENYQSYENESNKEDNSQLTDSQQMNNRQLTTNNNDKKERNKKNINIHKSKIKNPSDIGLSVDGDTMTDEEKRTRQDNIMDKAISSKEWIKSIMLLLKTSEEEVAIRSIRQFLYDLFAQDDFYKSFSEIKKHYVRSFKWNIDNKNKPYYERASNF